MPKSAFSLGIAADGLALLQYSGSAGSTILAQLSVAPEQLASPEGLANALRTLSKDVDCSGIALSVVLADQWVRMFMVTPPQNAGSLDDCMAAVNMRFSELYGENLSAWELRADWNAEEAFLACALPHSLLGVLKQFAAEQRWTLLAIAPQFIAAWNRWHKQLDGDAWFGVALGDRLSMGAIENKRLLAVNSISLPETAWQDERWLPTQLSREALRLNLSAPQQVRICGRIVGIPASRVEIAQGCKRLDAGDAALDTTPPSAALTLARMGMLA